MLSKFAVQIRRTIEKHQMLASRDRVLVGVSGGADSVCLALVLKEMGIDIGIAHLNHGLRGAESDGDEDFTKELATRLGVGFFVKKVSLLRPSPSAAAFPEAAPYRACASPIEAAPYRACASPRPLPEGEANLEAAGRQARKQFFNEVAAEHGFTKIALAHTANDRVETFLLNLLRGSGSEGLASMRPVSGAVIRPLIETGREEIERYLNEQNQNWRTDATNFDLGFARNRLRHTVLPELASKFNPNLLHTLSHTAEILESEDAWMAVLTEQWLEENGTREAADLSLPVVRLESEPLGLVRRVLRAALRKAGSDLRDVSFEQIEAARMLLNPGKSGKTVEIPGGLRVAREFDRLVFRNAAVPHASYSYELKIPGEVHIPEIGKVFRAEIIETEANDRGTDRVFVDAESIGPYVKIRNWKPGDYYRPVGLPGGKLKKLFQRARIPRGHRTGWPVIVADSAIVWVASFPVSREFAPRGHSQKKVAFEAL